MVWLAVGPERPRNITGAVRGASCWWFWRDRAAYSVQRPLFPRHRPATQRDVQLAARSAATLCSPFGSRSTRRAPWQQHLRRKSCWPPVTPSSRERAQQSTFLDRRPREACPPITGCQEPDYVSRVCSQTGGSSSFPASEPTPRACQEAHKG